MIKLATLLRELETEQNLSKQDKDKLKQARALLATLDQVQEYALSEDKITDVANKLKKLGLSAALTTLLAISSPAQQKAVDLAKAQAPTAQTSQTKVGTEKDGKYGQYTSQFRFPGASIIDKLTGTKTDLGLEGNNALKQLKSFGTDKMKVWNKLTDFAETHTINGKKIFGNSDLDKDPDLRQQVLDAFNASPEGKGSWIKGPKDVEEAQVAMKAYRIARIEDWKAGANDVEKGLKNTHGSITMSNDEMDPTNPDDIKRVESNFMLWAKDKK
jgi:hypothetical protein